MTTTPNDHDGGAPQDAALSAALNTWQAPQLAPSLKARIAQQLVRQNTPKVAAPLWPWTPFRLAGATLAAAAIGCVLGFAVPAATVAGPAYADPAADIAYDPAMDSVDLAALLW